MFYSHEILTSREHGIATVWLVATLGSKSITQRVNRKAIMNVDVPKACHTVIQPEAPIALRLQGNLLYGISKVYDQQCGYALGDIQSMRDRMRNVIRKAKRTALDPEAGQAKRDQLILPDDPSCTPNILIPGLDADVSALNIFLAPDAPAIRDFLSSQLQSTLNMPTSLSGQNLRLDLSSSDVPSALGNLHLGLPSEMSSIQQGGQGQGQRVELPAELPGYAEEKGVLLENDFEFDEEGNIVELAGRKDGDEQGGLADDGLGDGFNGGNEDWDTHGMEGTHDAPNETTATTNQPPTSATSKPTSLDPSYVPGTTSTTTANERPVHITPRKRHHRPLDPDPRPELRNSHLLEWNDSYARTMADAKRLKLTGKTPNEARKLAALWVLDLGLAEVGDAIGVGGGFEHALKGFSGPELVKGLLGPGVVRAARKRVREGDEEDEETARSVRSRLDGDVIDRDMEMLGLEGQYDDIELARDAPPPLDEQSSQMPWNITASIRAGSHPGSSIHSRRFIPSHGGLSSASGHGHVALAGRMSRMTSASPLAGRSRFVDSLGDLEKLPLPGEDSEMLGMGLETSSVGVLGMGMDVGVASSEIGVGGGRLGSVGRETQHDSFELFGPAARVDTQTAGESQWLRGVLDQESMNFLEFIRARMEEEEEEVGQGNGKGKGIAGVISFASLLPPEENTRIVATQALMHVLSLATRGALKVRQEESRYDAEMGCRMGEIYMALAA